MAKAGLQAVTVDANLSGFPCPVCGEIEYDADSAERYAAAGDALVLSGRGLPMPQPSTIAVGISPRSRTRQPYRPCF